MSITTVLYNVGCIYEWNIYTN